MPEWRNIPGFRDYEASSCGRIRRGDVVLKPQWIANRNCSRGYHKVYLWQYGKRYPRFVHRLVAMAFHGLPTEEAPVCSHLDHNSLNNAAANVAWSSQSANVTATFSEEAIEARARLELDCGLLSYMGPTERGMPF